MHISIPGTIFLAASTTVIGFNWHPGSRITRRTPAPFREPSPHTQSSYILQLTRKARALSNTSQEDKATGVAPLTKDSGGNVYQAEITFGDQTFSAVLDTGSSDTWVVRSNFTCFDWTGSEIVDQADCKFGSTYTPTSSFKQIPNVILDLIYGDDESLTGIVGTERVTFAGITIEGQTIGVVEEAVWHGDTQSSGLVGLAFPSLTSVINGTNSTEDVQSSGAKFNPVFTNMYMEEKVAPLFSLALDRSEKTGGLLAIGGLPPVKHSPAFESVPMELTDTPTNTPTVKASSGSYTFYTVSVAGLKYGENANNLSAPDHYIVDSGTSLIFAPDHISNSINALFDPPAILKAHQGEYVVKCDASIPRVGVTIGRQTFYINPLDLIHRRQDGTCGTGIGSSKLTGMLVLGDVFLRNVLAVFDVGASEMRFAARESY